MIPILVTGSNGQLGNEMRRLAGDFQELGFAFTDVDELDITCQASVDELVTRLRPKAIINCAAYTAVDQAEDDRDKALLINRDAVANLARAAKAIDALLIHVSTDYVFNGNNHRPYVETDATDPVSFYGRTKLEGEEQIRAIGPRYMIIRTSWLYSVHGNNFVKTMLRLGKERPELGVVADQVGTPTSAADLALTIVKAVQWGASRQAVHDILHFSNEGAISWYDFAVAIMEEAGLQCHVKPIESKDFPTRTKRPFYSVLNKAKIKESLGLTIPHWRASLRIVIDELES